MNIGILIVATNKYRPLMHDLIKSISSKFLTNKNKNLILFSDKDEFSSNYENVFFKEIEHEKWPINSLKRYEYFIKNKDLILKQDYIFYFDADLLVVEDIQEFDFCPLFAVSHPQNLLSSDMWDVEDNENSTAYLDPNKKGHYVQGCFWGGKPENIIDMCETLYKNANKDLENDYIAKWFDESHLNHYFYHNSSKVSIAPSSFSYPEPWDLPVPRLIIHRDKNHQEIRS